MTMKEEKNHPEPTAPHNVGGGGGGGGGNSSSSSLLLTCREVYDEMNDLLSSTRRRRSNAGFIRNYNRRIDMSSAGKFTVETELFPADALEAYSSYNLGREIPDQWRTKYFNAHRGGSQGDYSDGIGDKIRNVVDCLSKFPGSKRAVITIPNNTRHPNHTIDDDAKCMREIHLYLDEHDDDEASKEEEKEPPAAADDTSASPPRRYKLNATVWMRAQAAEIFPKNVHFIGSLMTVVASEIGSSLSRLDDDNDDDEDGAAQERTTKKKERPRVMVDVGELFYLATTLVSVRED